MELAAKNWFPLGVWGYLHLISTLMLLPFHHNVTLRLLFLSQVLDFDVSILFYIDLGNFDSDC